jgi:cytochrome P450
MFATKSTTMFFQWSLPFPSFISSIEILIGSFVAYYICWIIYSRFLHPYHDIPGPFLASITQWWYFRSIRYCIGENTQLPLHKKYGKFVRIGPNDVQIMDAKAIDVVYGLKPLFLKTEFYDSFTPNIGGRPDSFTQRDERVHDLTNKKIASLFAIGAVLEYEPCVDRVVDIFCDCMDAFAASTETFDISTFCRRYTFDAIGELFYGKEGGFGFLRDNKDCFGWMNMLDDMVPIVSSLGYIPWGLKIPYLLSHLALFPDVRKGLASAEKVKEQSVAVVKERREALKGAKEASRNDVLSKLMGIVTDRGEKIDFNDDDVATVVWVSTSRQQMTTDADLDLKAMIWAGSDTTGYVITGIFYHVLKHPTVYKKLVAEVREAFSDGKLSYPVQYKDAIKLPYLRACIAEGFRYSPASGTGLPRYVPKGGAVISGRYFPEGYKVIINSNAVHFDKECKLVPDHCIPTSHFPGFGEDAEEFVPERWLRHDEKTTAYMSRHDMGFGIGKRRCLGEKVRKMIIHRSIPS